MFWLLLTNLGIHSSIHSLRFALAGQLAVRLLNKEVLQAEPRRLLLIQQPHARHPDYYVIEKIALEMRLQVQWSSDRDEVAKLSAEFHPHVIVIHGWSELVKRGIAELRRSKEDTDCPIIVVSDDQSEQELNHAMDSLASGVTAYLPRSILPGALESLLRSLLQKIPVRAYQRPGLHDENLFCLDKTNRRAWIHGKEAHFPGQLFDLLSFLAKHPDTAISTDTLIEVLHPGRSAYLRPNTLAVKMYRLRSILEQAGAKDWLCTLRGYGYRFTPSKNGQNVIKKSFY